MTAPHIIVNATLGFGLVTIPVGIASAAAKKDVAFKTLHLPCLHPVNQVTVCTECDTQVTTDETCKGFQFTKGEFVALTRDEVEAASAGRSKVIGLTKFVPVTQVVPGLIEKSFLLVPNKTVGDGYWLLFRALIEKQAAGIGTCSLWGKESPCAIEAHPNEDGGFLKLCLLLCVDEVVNPMFDPNPVSEDAQRLSCELVEASMGELTQADLQSNARLRLDTLIQSKLAGVILDTPVAETKIPVSVDLIEALKRSLASVSV